MRFRLLLRTFYGGLTKCVLYAPFPFNLNLDILSCFADFKKRQAKLIAIQIV